jgi:hypothetical protein
MQEMANRVDMYCAQASWFRAEHDKAKAFGEENASMRAELEVSKKHYSSS